MHDAAVGGQTESCMLEPARRGAAARGRLTEAVIDLDAVAGNTRLLKAHSNGELMAVVKADGYGHGAVEVATTALAHGAGWLGVSFVAEALALRAAGLTAPILAWTLLPDEDLADALRANVDLSVSSARSLENLAACAESVGTAAFVHLEVDTGLRRSGARADDWPALVDTAARLEARGLIRARGIWSHLVHPHAPEHSTIGLQAAAFDLAVRRAQSAGLSAELLHLANSAALLAAPRTHYDMVRAGTALYGVEPVPGRTFGLRPAMSVRTRVIATHSAAADEGVSYGHVYTTSRAATLILMPLGYADGLPRSASAEAEVLVAGARRPVAGWIGMNQTVADLEATRPDVAAGEEVLVFGPGTHGEPTAAEWAAWAGTNVQEVLTAVGTRIPRHFLPEPGGRFAAPLPRTKGKVLVAVLFGGPGGEYEVSCASAAGIISNLDRARYAVQPVRITPDGRWVPGPADLPAGRYDADDLLRVTPTPAGGGRAAGSRPADVLSAVDVVVPALHGRFGEDGTVQALMEVVGVPYVGSGVAASAIGMDKDAAKRIVSASGLPVADWVVLRREEDSPSADDRERLGLPVYVKPPRSGSSVGVTRVERWAELEDALVTARKWDSKVLVEQEVAGREVDVAVIEHPDGRLEAGPPIEVEVLGGQPYFDYDAKYRDERTRFVVPAALDPRTTAELQRLAVQVFEVLGCSGLARVDFLLRAGSVPVFNEINTMPGFTGTSQYPRIWKAAGLSYSPLLDILIETAFLKSPAGVAATR